MADPKHNPTHLPFEVPLRDAPAELPGPKLPQPPFWMISIALIGIVLTWLPLSIIARTRVSTSPDPRIQIAQDMGVQPKFREQQTNMLFADQRAMRPGIDGTVARGQLEDDDHFYRGFVRVKDAKGAWVASFDKTFPDRVKLTAELLHRGQQRFNIYCFTCHGWDGSGNGPVSVHVTELRNNGVSGISWTQPAVLTSDRIRAQAVGQIFNTITNGIRNMPSYSAQIPVEDRWAIIAYVRALQYSQEAPSSVVPSGTAIADAIVPPTTAPSATTAPTTETSPAPAAK
jgi:mono/diheme cytochrome c family protein